MDLRTPSGVEAASRPALRPADLSGEPAEPEVAADALLTVFYDGGCPVCSREIGFYRDRPGTEGLAWVDVSREAPMGPGAGAGGGPDRATALARFHVRLPDGRIVSGAAAFAALWQRVPGFRRLGRLVSWRPVAPAAELAYRAFLRLRRLWR